MSGWPVARVWRQIAVMLVVLVCCGLLFWAWWWVPMWMVGREGRAAAALVDEHRRTLTQMLGGLAGLVALYFLYRRTKATEETLRVAEENLRVGRGALEISQGSLDVTRDGQIAERFARAVEQLGACDKDGNKQIEIRFGGIYALERIARSSPQEHWTIMEVLTAYVRKNSPLKEQAEAGGEAAASAAGARPDADVQTILTVLGRRKATFGTDEDRCLDLHAAHLRGADLRRRHPSNCPADYRGACLVVADLASANLEGVDLTGADLSGADLTAASLAKANLSWASLGEAQLSGADLRKAVGLTQHQINTAHGNRQTMLPKDLERPASWAQ